MKSNNSTSNYQDFLKLLAVISMIIDHVGYYIFNDVEVLRIIGRYAMPIFLFFSGYNFKKKPKHIILCLGVMLAIYQCYDPVTPGYPNPLNILITIYLGQTYLLISKNTNLVTQIILLFVLGVSYPYTRYFFDYGTLGIAIVAAGYLAKNYPGQIDKLALFVAISSYLTSLKYNLHHFFLVNLIYVSVYITLSKGSFARPISINLSLIRNNLLSIYVGHIGFLYLIRNVFLSIT